jgi:hypothetical protein
MRVWGQLGSDIVKKTEEGPSEELSWGRQSLVKKPGKEITERKRRNEVIITATCKKHG